jgi:hypothetical protein
VTARAQLNHLFDRWAVWIFLLLASANTITGGINPNLEGPLQWVMWPLLTLYLVGIFKLGLKHEPITCGTCWDLFPVNPGEHAARRSRPWFAAVHTVIWLADRLRRLPFLDGVSASIIATMTMLVTVVGVARIVIDPPWISLVALLYVALIVHSARRHAQLQPWCPWCRRRGKGDEEPKTPDPQPSTGRDLALEGAK